MDKNIYNFANLNICVEAPKEIIKKMAPFLNESSDIGNVFFDIKIVKSENIMDIFEHIKPDLPPKMGLKIFQLKSFTYLYDQLKNKCYAINSKFVGIINYSANNAIWYFDDTTIPSRNMFHTFILDFLSLIMPKENKIVFHGAAIEANDCAILLLGRSGSGKSTISHRLTECYPDCRKLCDDTFILDVGEKSLLYPLNTGEGYNIDIANRLLKKESYINLFYNDVSKKKYIISKASSLDIKIEVKKVVFLNRYANSQSEIITKTTKCTNRQLFINILNSQTNITTPYLKQKYELYKEISKNIDGFSINYNYDCDIDIFKNEGII